MFFFPSNFALKRICAQARNTKLVNKFKILWRALSLVFVTVKITIMWLILLQKVEHGIVAIENY